MPCSQYPCTNTNLKVFNQMWTELCSKYCTDECKHCHKGHPRLKRSYEQLKTNLTHQMLHCHLPCKMVLSYLLYNSQNNLTPFIKQGLGVAH